MSDDNKPLDRVIQELTGHGVIDAIGEGLIILNTNYRIIYQNQKAIDMSGGKSYLGKLCYEAYYQSRDICEGCPQAITFKYGKTNRVERKAVINNEERHFEVTASPIKNSHGTIIAGIEIVRDITARKTAEETLKEAEKKMRIQAANLAESNIALKVLLKQRENDKKEFEENILSNIKHLILPYIEMLKGNKVTAGEVNYLNILESNLKEIISPFSSRLSSNYMGFTPKEIQVANLVKDGKRDKDIMEILNISFDTVKTHRRNIRKKVGIDGKKINLRTYLLTRIR